MSLGGAVKARVSEWYGRNADIRQVRIYQADDGDLHVVVALRPVCDSDDVSPIWLAKRNRWREQLEALIGRRVHLDSFDGDTEVPPYADGSGNARVCLAGIAWRVSADNFSDTFV